MVIFLYGPDSYRRDQKKRWYTSEFQKKYSAHGVEHVDLESGDPAPLSLAARSRSLFEPAKLIVLTNAFEITPKKLQTALEPFLKDKQLNALMAADKKPEKAMAFLLEKPVISVEFDYPKEGAAWLKFVRDEAAAQKADLEPAALALLARTYEKDSWGLVTELQKLAGAGKKLAAADLAALGVEVAPDFFPLIQTLRSARLSDRFAALARLFRDNEPAAKIFNLISALWPQKTPQFAAYDRAVKMGKMDYEEALTDLLIS
jgi:DNA polymerase III delta subunit